MARYLSPAQVRWRTPSKYSLRRRRHDGRQRRKLENYVDNLSKFQRKYQQVQPGVQHEAGAATRPNTPVPGSETEPAPAPAPQQHPPNENVEQRKPSSKRLAPRRFRKQRVPSAKEASSKSTATVSLSQPTPKDSATPILSLLERLSEVAENQGTVEATVSVTDCDVSPEDESPCPAQSIPPPEANPDLRTGEFPSMPAAWFCHPESYQPGLLTNVFAGLPSATKPGSDAALPNTSSPPPSNQQHAIGSVFCQSSEHRSSVPSNTRSSRTFVFQSPRETIRPSVFGELPQVPQPPHNEQKLTPFATFPVQQHSQINRQPCEDIEMADSQLQESSFISQQNSSIDGMEDIQFSQSSQVSQMQPSFSQQNANLGQINQNSFQTRQPVPTINPDYPCIAPPIQQHVSTSRNASICNALSFAVTPSFVPPSQPVQISNITPATCDSLPYATSSQPPTYNTSFNCNLSVNSMNPPQALQVFASIQPPPNPLPYSLLEQPHVIPGLPTAQYQAPPPPPQQPTSINPIIHSPSMEELIEADPPLDSSEFFEKLKAVGKKYPAEWSGTMEHSPSITYAEYRERSGQPIYTKLRNEVEAARKSARHQDRLRAESSDERNRKLTKQQQQQQNEENKRKQEKRRAKENREKEESKRILQQAEARAKKLEAQESSARYRRALHASKYEVPYRCPPIRKPNRLPDTPVPPAKPSKPSLPRVEHHRPARPPYTTTRDSFSSSSSSSFSSSSEEFSDTKSQPGDFVLSSINAITDALNAASRWCTTVLAQWDKSVQRPGSFIKKGGQAREPHKAIYMKLTRLSHPASP